MGHTVENRAVKIGRVTIGKRCTLGSMSAVLPGAVLADGCTIGDMSLVMKNELVPAGAGECPLPAALAACCLPLLLRLAWGRARTSRPALGLPAQPAAREAPARPDLALKPHPLPPSLPVPAVWCGIPAVPVDHYKLSKLSYAASTFDGLKLPSDGCSSSDGCKLSDTGEHHV